MSPDKAAQETAENERTCHVARVETCALGVHKYTGRADIERDRFGPDGWNLPAVALVSQLPAVKIRARSSETSLSAVYSFYRPVIGTPTWVTQEGRFFLFFVKTPSYAVLPPAFLATRFFGRLISSTVRSKFLVRTCAVQLFITFYFKIENCSPTSRSKLNFAAR